jgi:hypothetical protein
VPEHGPAPTESPTATALSGADAPVAVDERVAAPQPARTGRRWFERLPRPRPATYLLVGWCVVWAAWIPAASMWIPHCPDGQTWCVRTPVLTGARTISSYLAVAVLGALALLALWLWDGRHAAAGSADPAGDPTPRRRTRPVALAVGSIVAVAASAHLMLFAPAATLPTQCTATIHLNSAMSYCLNVDSPEFFKLAHHPRQVLEPNAIRQARPGYVALSAVGARVIGPAASHLGLDRMYGQTDPAYIPLILMNFVTVAVAVMLLGLLLARLGTPLPAAIAICTFLAVNDVVKAFIWTPHQDVFTTLIPIATVFVAQWVIRADPPWWKLAVLGLALGAYSLVYGSVLITVAVVGLVLLARGWRGTARAVTFGAAFAVLPAGWIVVCRMIVGSYYNHEASAYHEFVWPVVAAQRGSRALARYVEVVSIATVREVVSAAGLFLLLIVALAAMAVRCRIRLKPESREHRAILVASVLTVAVSVVFGWAIGYIANRLMFNVVPPLLVCLGWLATRLSARSGRMRMAIAAFLSVVAAAVVAVTVTTPGPWD